MRTDHLDIGPPVQDPAQVQPGRAQTYLPAAVVAVIAVFFVALSVRSCAPDPVPAVAPEVQR
jgi:hypothetical protein